MCGYSNVAREIRVGKFLDSVRVKPFTPRLFLFTLRPAVEHRPGAKRGAKARRGGGAGESE
jgi:hypothetical protein